MSGEEIRADFRTALKPCPFCGHNAEMTEKYHTDEGYIISVGCSNCFCKITKNLWFDFNKSCIENTIAKMVEKWNMRI